jgi:hypothetical protein
MLQQAFQKVIKVASNAVSESVRAFESLKSLSEVVGGEYGERVLYELIQNAHDAHQEGDVGQILIRLVINGPASGELYVANGGRGFAWENVDALRNIGLSSKTVGEGIGNKGLGFRSVETLTDDPRIYSQPFARECDRFDGFCFRFARADEILDQARTIAPPDVAAEVARTLPRYLAATAIGRQDAEIRAFAGQGFATCVHLPLRRESAICSAEQQIAELLNSRAPLLLFLDRLTKIVIEIEGRGRSQRKILRRKFVEQLLPDAANRYEIVALEPGGGRYLVVKAAVEEAPLKAAVEKSIDFEPQLTRWRDWQGTPHVSAGIAIGQADARPGVIFNFLPMSADRPSPIHGHIDAPFYASINRKEFDPTLPLNAFLLDEIAKATAAAAIELKPVAAKVSRPAIFDLGAWDPADTHRLSSAWKHLGSEWHAAEIVPAAGSDEVWSSVYNSWIWPERGLRLLRVSRLIKAGIDDLADPALGELRLQRLAGLINTLNIPSAPDAERLGEWLEMVARSLFAENVGVKSWSTFYAELHRLLGNIALLRHLQGREIFLGRDGKLHQAAKTSPAAGDKPLFLRERFSAKRRDRQRSKLPPPSISRKFALVDDSVEMDPGIVSDFVKAGLVRSYDPLEILGNLHSLFGDKPAPGRREDALCWAFDIWRSEGSRAEAALLKARLMVETRSGWKPAGLARFSDGWTSEGRKLASYLAEAAPLSPDCKEAAGFLLAGAPSWAPVPGDGRRDWVRFLRVLGVRDGLPLLRDTDAPQRGFPSDVWNPFRREVDDKVGRTKTWVRQASAQTLNHPYTNYTRRGELWRFPGQIEHESFATETRQRFCDLILELLGQSDGAWLQWKLGRFERDISRIDEATMPTPAATFLGSEAWLPVDGEDGKFDRPVAIWSIAGRRQRPPRFASRLPDRLTDLLTDNEQLQKRMFGKQIGLRDWTAPEQSLAKLQMLARTVETLDGSDRAEFRRTYLATWTQALQNLTELPADFSVAVQVNGVFERRAPKEGEKPILYISANSQSAEARAASAAGLPILEVEQDDQVEALASLLNSTDRYEPREINHGGVEVLADGIRFTPSDSDPLLASGEREWLLDAAILAKEILGSRTLESAIPTALLEERLGKVRLRFAGDISLSIDGVPTGEHLPFYGYPDPNLPTLIIGGGRELDLKTVAEGASVLQQLLDGRLRTFETVLVKLALWNQSGDGFDRPTDEEYARALACRPETVRDHLAEREGSNRRIATLLRPVVAYFAGIKAAQDFGIRCDDARGHEDIARALADIPGLPLPHQELIELAEAAGSLTDIRLRLGLDLGMLNRALISLGQAPLTNEAELRRLFEIWKSDLRQGAIDRLRRHFWKKWSEGSPLADYDALSSLEFLQFPEDWALSRDTVTRDDVEQLISQALDERIGEDIEQPLAPLAETAKRSQRVLQQFCGRAAPVIAAWCNARGSAVGDWADGGIGIPRLADQLGLLDFAAIEEGGELELIGRAGLWPEGMKKTLDLEKLGLKADDLDRAKQRERELEEEAARKRRTIIFLGHDLDTAAASFAREFISLAEQNLSDGAWLKRSSRPKLVVQQDGQQRGRGGPGGKGVKGGRKVRVSEDVKSAMGFASELLASRFLARKHKHLYNDDCWVSANRRLALLGDEGDDTLGFDFQVNIVEGDWKYEVKSSLDDGFEFEFTQNEMRVAAAYASDAKHRYRILYVPFVFDPNRWRVLELPNPMSEKGRLYFRTIGAGATRLKFGIE